MAPKSENWKVWAHLKDRALKAAGSDRDLDEDLFVALGGDPGGVVPNYSGSVEQAMTLVEALLPGWHWRAGVTVQGRRYGGVGVMLMWSEPAPTLALTIIAAACLDRQLRCFESARHSA